MATKVLILGSSGSGKSASLRNFKPEEVLVINSAGKPLPFRNHFETVTPEFKKMTSDVIKAMDSTKKKVIIIDDAQYIMSFQYMRRIKENGWDKWNDIQGDFFNIIQHCDELPADTIVYILSHIQRDEEGFEKIKTMGKMLDEKITLEGLFTVVLKTSVADGQYCFITQNSGKDTVKSPIGMFDSYAIDNDLKYVDTKIRNYYEIGDFVDDEKVAQMDQEAKKEAISKESSGGRRSRRKSASEVKEAVEQEGLGTAEGQGTIPKPAPSTESAAEGSATETEVKADTWTPDQGLEQPQQVAVPMEVARRRRKVRNNQDQEEINKEAPAEEAQAEAAAEGSTEAPKRRRRRTRDEVTEPDESITKLIKEQGIANDYSDLPFEV